jgi:hypothetical protein
MRQLLHSIKFELYKPFKKVFIPKPNTYERKVLTYLPVSSLTDLVATAGEI